MVKVSAKKKFDIHNILAIATLQVKEKRPDIVWLIRNIGKWGLTKGETRNLENYLSRNLNLMRNGDLTPTGKKILSESEPEVLIPESGIYELFYVNDPILGHKIIDFVRRKASSKEQLEGNVEEFERYSEYNGNYYQTWNDRSSEFFLQFDHARNEYPQVIHRLSSNATLTISSNEDGRTNLAVKADNLRYEYKESGYSHFLLNKNMIRLIENWSEPDSAKLVSFEDIYGKPEAQNFETSEHFEGTSLLFSWGEDESDYEVDIRGIKLLPMSEKDAIKWLFYLIVEELQQEEAYLSLQYVEELETKILRRTPLKKRYPDLWLNGQEILNRIGKYKEYEKIWWQIQVTEDLSPIF